MPGVSDPCGVAVNDTHIFWGNNGGDAIGRANLDGTGVDQNFITGADNPCGVTLSSAATPPAPPGQTDNRFQVGKVKKNKLTVTVPGPGEVVVTDAKAKKKSLKRSSATAAAAGDVKVKLKLVKKAKQALKSKGKVKVNAAITFTPTGGEANTQENLLLPLDHHPLGDPIRGGVRMA